MTQKTPEVSGVRPFHPFLIGAYPVITLIGHNIVEITPVEGLRPLVVSLLLVGLVFVLTKRISGWSWGRAGLLASLFAILFFSYGHLYTFLEGATMIGFNIGRHLVLGPLYLVAWLAGFWGLARLPDPAPFTRSLNWIGLALLLVPLFQIGAHEIAFMSSQDGLPAAAGIVEPPRSDASQPDIYYIVLDAYSREDILLDLYEFDNTPFLQALQERGFYIPFCTRSNYARTFLSLSSTLNMDYVPDLTSTYEHAEFTALIKDNLVRQKLSAQGYSIIAFDAGYFRTQWPDADQWYSYKSGGGALRSVSEFETLIIETTGLFFLLDANAVLGGAPLEVLYESTKLERYNRVNYIFDTLETVVESPGPKFVFVHVPSPHSPYIFTQDGVFRPDPADVYVGYRDQVAYLNQRVLPIVDKIQDTADPAPIIILQGDHGAGETKPDFRRLNILNAYYLPGDAKERLYPKITPVNTFRVIFDAYFGEELGLVPDVSYFSPPDDNLAFSVAPDSRPGCEGD